MKNGKAVRILPDLLRFILILCMAVLLSMLLSGVNDDNNPFAMGIFILAVALVARFTSGYLWGIAASLVGTFCVNYIFTYPFWTFDITYPGYALTAAVMLIVSVIISALTTQIKLQEQRLPPQDQATLIGSIRRDAQWLVRVTENLLSVTRISGDVSLKKEDEVLEEIIGSAVHKYRRAADALPVRVEAPDEILVVPMDAVLIEQVLLNLFDNVSAHAQNATQIWIYVCAGADKVSISVEDDGVGMSREQRSRMLEGAQFSEQSDKKRGMGIGLSVCRSIIHAHHGTLSAGRSAHGGLALRFELPVKEGAYGPDDPQ